MRSDKLFLFGILLLMVSSFVIAEDSKIEIPALEDLCKMAENGVNQVIGQKIPEGIPYQDEVFNLYKGENTSIGSLTIVEGEITNLSCGENDEPTFNIYIEGDDTIKDIIEADDKLAAYKEKKSNDEIRIEGATFTKSIKQFFVNIGITIASWFS